MKMIDSKSGVFKCCNYKMNYFFLVMGDIKPVTFLYSKRSSAYDD